MRLLFDAGSVGWVTEAHPLLLCGGCPLLHAGFTHAAFSLAHESQVHTAGIDPSQVPAGALVTFIQKGMQYLELEANVEVGERAAHGATCCGGGPGRLLNRARAIHPSMPALRLHVVQQIPRMWPMHMCTMCRLCCLLAAMHAFSPAASTPGPHMRTFIPGWQGGRRVTCSTTPCLGSLPSWLRTVTHAASPAPFQPTPGWRGGC